MAAWRPSAILDFEKFIFLTADIAIPFGGSVYVILPNFVPTGQIVVEIWLFFMD